VKYKKLIIALFVVVIVLAVILWIVAAKFVTRQKIGAEKFQMPTDAPSLTLNTLATKVERMIDPAATRTAEEKARASEQFGAALQKAGIETQPEPSH
jgi:hypothetical protein